MHLNHKIRRSCRFRLQKLKSSSRRTQTIITHSIHTQTQQSSVKSTTNSIVIQTDTQIPVTIIPKFQSIVAQTEAQIPVITIPTSKSIPIQTDAPIPKPLTNSPHSQTKLAASVKIQELAASVTTQKSDADLFNPWETNLFSENTNLFNSELSIPCKKQGQSTSTISNPSKIYKPGDRVSMVVQKGNQNSKLCGPYEVLSELNAEEYIIYDFKKPHKSSKIIKSDLLKPWHK